MTRKSRLVAVFAPLYPPAFRGGGPIRSIEALVLSTPAELEPAVLTSDRDLGSSEPLEVDSNVWLTREHGSVCYVTTRSPYALWRAFRSLRMRRPRVLHFNSFMNPRLTILPLLLWRLGFWGRARVVISPRGEFGSGALGRRAGKKGLYIKFFRALGIHRSTIWHSTAPHETTDIRQMWGPEARVVERSNDTRLASQPRTATSSAGPLRAVFLGRLVEHKGLLLALQALSNVTSPVRFDVYGSREDEVYAAACEAVTETLPKNVNVYFHGAIPPDNVVDVLVQHDVLLMPTAGENFGHVIAEALSASCFVVTTPHTPWTPRISDSGGLVLAREVGPWAEAIETLAGEGAERRLARRRDAGRTYSAWFAEPRPPHLWSLILDEMSPEAKS